MKVRARATNQAECTADPECLSPIPPSESLRSSAPLPSVAWLHHKNVSSFRARTELVPTFVEHHASARVEELADQPKFTVLLLY